MTIERIEPGARLSEAVAYGNLVFLAGHVAEDTSVGMYEQAANCLRQIDAHLAAVGSDKSKLLTVQIWITDMDLFPELNRAWDEWVDKANLPARATVESRLASPGWLVEIAGVAAR